MSEQLCLVATIGGRQVAVEAGGVSSVVDLGPLVPVPGADPAVCGLAALRSQVVTVIDPCRRLGADSRPDRRRALVTRVDGHEYAVLVEDCSDIARLPVTTLPAGLALDAQWRTVARGVAVADEAPLLMIALDALIPVASAA